MWPIFIVIVAVGLATAAAYRIELNRIPRKQKRFRERKSFSLEEIYNEHFSGSGIDQSRFEYLWIKAATILRLDPKKLLPSDRFDRELSPVEWFFIEDELADLEAFYFQELKKKWCLS